MEKYYPFIIAGLGILWLITLIGLFAEKKRSRILKKNSDWASDKAREKAEKIIAEAKDAALNELQDIKLDTDQFKQTLEAGVKKLTDQEIVQYKDAIENITEGVEEGVKEQSEQFKTEFNKSWEDLQKEMQDQIKQDYQEEKEKLKQYTGVKMKEIEEKIAGIMDEAVLNVLDKQVDKQINKKLIVAALEEAKKKNVI